MITSNYCKDIEQSRTEKFMEVHFQYSPYSTVKELIEDLFPYLRRHLTAKYKPYYTTSSLPLGYSTMKAWILKDGLEKNIFFNVLRAGCKANSTFEYKLFFDGECLDKEKALNEYDLSILTQFVFEVKEDNQKSWMFFNEKTPFEGVCNYCRTTTMLPHLCSCKYAAYCSSSCKTKDKFTHKGRCPNDAESE